MGLDLNGWDMDDIQKQMRDKTIFELIILYKEKENELILKSKEYLQARRDKNEVAIERIKKECEHIEKEHCVIAIEIADKLSVVSKNK